MHVSNPAAVGALHADANRDRAQAERGARIAGISGFKRNAAVAICRGGSLAAVCQEERVTRRREVGVETGGFPMAAFGAALQSAGVHEDHIAEIVVGEPGLGRFCRGGAREIGHHHAHAATSFLTSGCREAIVVVCDTNPASEVTVWRGSGSRFELLDVPWRGPGFARVYSRLTTLLGFPAGAEPIVEAVARLHRARDAGRAAELVGYADGTLSIAPGFDEYVENARHGGLEHVAMAAGSVQSRLAELFVEFLEDAARWHAAPDLCVGGGLFFNTYFNSVIRNSGVFERVHIPVNPGNGGVAAGCALVRGYHHGDRTQPEVASPFLGPESTNEQIKAVLDNCKLSYAFLEDWRLLPLCVEALARGELVGWFRGRLEWGPRALGNRSILANPLAPYALENLNRFLKQRAPYRTYGLAVCEEDASRFFEGPPASPYMECEFTLRDPERFAGMCPAGVSRLRVQTVSSDPSPLRSLLVALGQRTGVPVLVNTSFNGFHEPIVCSPRDAVRVFYGSGLDMLVIGNFVLRK